MPTGDLSNSISVISPFFPGTEFIWSRKNDVIWKVRMIEPEPDNGVYYLRIWCDSRPKLDAQEYDWDNEGFFYLGYLQDCLHERTTEHARVHITYAAEPPGPIFCRGVSGLGL